MKVMNIAVGKKYQAKDGQEKTRWSTIGVAFIKDDGKINGIIETVPLNWDGSFILFDKDNNNNQTPQPQGGYSQPAQQQSQYQAPVQQQSYSQPQQQNQNQATYDPNEQAPF